MRVADGIRSVAAAPTPLHFSFLSILKKLTSAGTTFGYELRRRSIVLVEPSVTQNKTLNDRFLQKVVRKHRKTWREAERREVGSGDSGQDAESQLTFSREVTVRIHQ